ncbi:MAG TPA: prephenate dehydrogenase/arogenate dehydrogenase family protein [Mycobacteriales bacterium]
MVMTPATERLHVVGAGLMGASVALAADAAGWSVTVQDVRPERVDLVARQLRTRDADDRDRPPDVVCVAVPPGVVATCVAAALSEYVNATVIDLASVKARPLAEIQDLVAPTERFVPSHPLAGSELSGPEGARAELFRGRTWVVCPDGAGALALARAEGLARACGATPVRMSAAVHDRLLAFTSHLPQLLASSLAQAVDAGFALEPLGGSEPMDQGAATSPAPSLVAGPALLDMTRIAASPAALWAEVAEANRDALRPALGHVLTSLQELHDALGGAETTRQAVTALVEAGARGRARISPKHTSAPRPDRPRLGAADPEASWVWVDAVVDDAPGALARLFQIADELQVNIEDLHVDHAPHAATGVVSMAVRAQHADRLRAALGPRATPESR